MNIVLRIILKLFPLMLILSACGSADVLDFSIRFTGTLTQSGSPVQARICALGECDRSAADGRFSFKGYDWFRGGDVTVSVHINGRELTRVINLPGNAEEVSMQLVIADNSQVLFAERVEVVRTKQAVRE